jgi:3-oxoadipate enol-lactonase
MSIVAINGIDVYYEVHGSGTADGSADAPWVLNIGGTGGDLRQTFPDRSPLNAEFRVVSYDQRGLGQTAKPEIDYTMADYTDDAAGLIDEVIGGPCHVVGTSFGGMVALNLAIRRPDLVDRLVLLVTSPGGDHASYRLSELESMAPIDVFPIRMRLLDRRWDPDADEPIPGLGPIYDFIVAQRNAVLTPDVAAGLSRQLAARDGHDVVDQLRSIEHETLICAGRYDDLAPVTNSEFLADHMANARLEVFEGGHMVMFQDRRVWPTVIEFLAHPTSEFG